MHAGKTALPPTDLRTACAVVVGQLYYTDCASCLPLHELVP
jgi:hypothetical protein